MKTAQFRVMSVLVFVMALCITSQAQEAASAFKRECLSLKMIGQTPAPKIKEKPAADVIVAVPDDLHIRFEFHNNCTKTIYYLAETIHHDRRGPTGFLLYRSNENNWTARTPSWRREGSLTDPYLYYWLPLRANERIEFEYSDLSVIEGERSLAIYVNESPCHEKRFELLATPFKIKKTSDDSTGLKTDSSPRPTQARRLVAIDSDTPKRASVTDALTY
jgi:hypothetical protein